MYRNFKFTYLTTKTTINCHLHLFRFYGLLFRQIRLRVEVGEQIAKGCVLRQTKHASDLRCAAQTDERTHKVHEQQEELDLKHITTNINQKLYHDHYVARVLQTNWISVMRGFSRSSSARCSGITLVIR